MIKMDTFLFTILGCLFITGILEIIAEIIIDRSNDKENPQKSRRLYFSIFFFILLLLYSYTTYNREKYIRNTIEQSNSIEEITEILYEDSER
jgi:hypothetical protein